MKAEPSLSECCVTTKMQRDVKDTGDENARLPSYLHMAGGGDVATVGDALANWFLA